MRRVRAFLVLVAALFAAQPLSAYSHLTFSVQGQPTRIKWEEARVRWFATSRAASGVSTQDFQATLQRAFETWESLPTASIAFQFVGPTSALPFEDDGISVLGFEDHPELDRVLAATTFVVDTRTGEIVESDVFFNSAFLWSVSANGDAARFDLESVALHEIGHFVGLGHSALGETEPRPEGARRVLGSGAVMFPISFGRGNVADRELQPDDIAAVSDLYPDGDFRDSTGIASGRIRRAGGAVLGAHVVAFHLSTGELISAFALGDGGEFQIAGLRPGPHVIRVEPIDDADIESFFSSLGIDVDFLVTYYERLFIAPEGGSGSSFDVTVRPK